MKKIPIILITVVIILFLIAAYFGFIPGVSAIFMKQIDLGVTSDPAVVESMHAETGYIDNLDPDNPTSNDLVYSGELPLNRQFTNEEISSYLNVYSQEWQRAPFRNVQVMVHEDGIVEASAMVNVEKAIDRAVDLGYSQDQIDMALKYIKYLPDELPVYAKGTGKIENNEVTVDLQGGKIGNLPVPSNYLEPINGAIEDMAERKMAEIPNLNVISLEAENGNIAVDAVIPKQVD